MRGEEERKESRERTGREGGRSKRRERGEGLIKRKGREETER